jgi:tetratricopeptide (TPR) repeat protein
VQLAPSYESAIDRKYLAEALRCFVQARNLCPVLARAQLRLVALAAKLDRADEPSQYLERARVLAGYDPEFWFMGGALALAEKRNEDCWPLWNRSLAISKKHFREILNQARLVIKPQEILDKLLPDSPELIVESANQLLRNPKSEEERAVRAEYFKRAAYLLRQETGEINADGWVVRASVSQELGQDKNAITALRMAMSLDPKYEDLRLQMAKIMFNNGDKPQAMREVLTVLTRQPWNVEALKLRDELTNAPLR